MSVSFPLPHVVLTELRASHPHAVLCRIAEALELSDGVSADTLTDLLMKADHTGGSAIGDGVAVVAARVPLSVSASRLCAIARLARPVVFSGVENQPCDLVFVMVSPDDKVPSHLRDLSCVIRALRNSDLVTRLRSENDHERILNLFRAHDMVLRAAA